MLTPDAHQKAANIERQLHAAGFVSVMVKFMPEADAIGANFILCSAPPTWRKLLVDDPDEASAERFIEMFRKWQSSMRTRMATSALADSPALRGALVIHGEDAVKIALHA